MTSTVPTLAAANRLAAALAETDRLLALLAKVADGHRLTNRLNEAILLVPGPVMADIRQAIGAAPEQDTTP